MIVFLHLLYLLPAAFGLTAGARGLLPFEMDDRLLPVFMIVCCLITLYLPLTLCLAVGLSPVVGLLFKYTHTPLKGYTPFKYTRPNWKWLRLPHRDAEEVPPYVAPHVSGDLKDIPVREEPGDHDDPPARNRQYIPEL
jgi:hypothetical protein